MRVSVLNYAMYSAQVLFQNDNTFIYSEWGLTEWFEYENDVNHLLWSLQSVLKNISLC